MSMLYNMQFFIKYGNRASLKFLSVDHALYEKSFPFCFVCHLKVSAFIYHTHAEIIQADNEL